MKQTAVEWYAEQEIKLTLDFISKKINDFEYGIKKLRLIEQAKEMEKEQIIEAYNTSFLLRDKPYSTAEKYYKETYESNT
jgi:hypothetical protein